MITPDPSPLCDWLPCCPKKRRNHGSSANGWRVMRLVLMLTTAGAARLTAAARLPGCAAADTCGAGKTSGALTAGGGAGAASHCGSKVAMTNHAATKTVTACEKKSHSFFIGIP